jgi:hypothetical protein
VVGALIAAATGTAHQLNRRNSRVSFGRFRLGFVVFLGVMFAGFVCVVHRANFRHTLLSHSGRRNHLCRRLVSRGGKMMPYPTVTIDEKKIILLSGFRTEAGKRVVVTAKQKLAEAAKRHRDAVAFGYVSGRWMPPPKVLEFLEGGEDGDGGGFRATVI